MRLWLAGLSGLLVAGLLSAQYPGQYPGQYPSGDPGIGGLPLPRIPFPGRGKKKAEEKKPDAKTVTEQFHGTVEKVEKDSFTIRATDSRLLTFRWTKDTQYRRDGEAVKRETLAAGLTVDVEARSNEGGFYFADSVQWQSVAVKDEPARTSSSVIVKDSEETDDPNRPVLRRGKPAPRAKAEEPEAAVKEAAEVVVVPPEPEKAEDDPLLEKARMVANAFEETLPNYICNQFTTRFQGEGKPIRWQAQDVVSAAVAYQDGKETYHDIKVNNKATNKPMEEIGGSWSRGEFGTTLRDLFSPATAAQFRRGIDSTASGRSAVVYDFEVKQPNSHWQTMIGGQSVMPAYKGSVWIDKQTARVLRIEMQARKVPQSFPLDTIEWVVDYAFVRIGTKEFLLPAHAENLACWRGTSQCARSSLDFRNYRKFTSESQILVTDSTVTFDKE